MMSPFFFPPRRVAMALLAALAVPCLAAGSSAEQIVGGIEAMVFVCLPIDAKSVKPGQEILQRAVEQRKLDLPAIRKTEAYRNTYNRGEPDALAAAARAPDRLPDRLVGASPAHPKRGIAAPRGGGEDAVNSTRDLLAMPAAPDPHTPRQPSSSDAQEMRWHELLQRLQSLNAQLEYLKLMMKLGVH